MSRNLLSEFIHHLDLNQDMEIAHAPDEVIEWIEALGLPMSIRRFLQWDWPQVDSQIGHIAIMSSANVYSNDWVDDFTTQKLLWLGSAPNGDAFVLDYSTDQCIPGFIAQAECWTGKGGLKTPSGSSFNQLRGRWRPCCIGSSKCDMCRRTFTLRVTSTDSWKRNGKPPQIPAGRPDRNVRTSESMLFLCSRRF